MVAPGKINTLKTKITICIYGILVLYPVPYLVGIAVVFGRMLACLLACGRVLSDSFTVLDAWQLSLRNLYGACVCGFLEHDIVGPEAFLERHQVSLLDILLLNIYLRYLHVRYIYGLVYRMW